ncbi:MAG: hypothetical protein HFH68_16025 [Lachnospiraceae bacterium]|nr:hypothetical protein [Lachnospiraceae bacterium]
MNMVLAKENMNEKNKIWQEAIEALIDPSYGMDEEESAAYMGKIMAKLKSGKNLTQEELNYLSLHNQQLYMTALRVKYQKEALKNRLKNCRSKEEAQEVIDNAIGGVNKDDPDKEYLIAGFREVEKEFKKSGNYSRLPDKDEKSERKKLLKYLDNNYNNEEEAYDNVFNNEKVTPIAELLDILPVFEAKA